MSNESKTLLVTGGAGVMGRRLCKGLIERGFEMRVLDRPGTRIEGVDADLRHGDITDPSTLEGLFDGDTDTMVVSPGINPVWVQVELTESLTFTGAAACFNAGDNRWMLAAADSVADMDGQTGSYRVVVPWRTASGPSRW